ncbi:MAG: hypothetical protein WAK11_04225 [Candidatus Cybelea sp.]
MAGAPRVLTLPLAATSSLFDNRLASLAVRLCIGARVVARECLQT